MHTKLAFPQLLQARALRQGQFDAGGLPDFHPETKAIREDETWYCAPPAPGMEDRRVEITGPVDRKMVAGLLSSFCASSCLFSRSSTL